MAVPAPSAATLPPLGRSGYGFGTFKGVFLPSILTILGVIMFLRFPWVLGSVGLGGTLLIVTLSVAITLLTGLSIAAMATNMRVGGGGAYYMISRTLGLEVGAAVGLPLFLAQALGIAFYIAGFSETVVGLFPALSPAVIGVATLLTLTLLAYTSADLAIKSQFVILTVLVLALGSLFLGGPPSAAGAVTGEALPRASFWVAFAVFFPARFQARIQVICHAGDPFTVIARQSRSADLLFLGLRPIAPDESFDDYAAYYASLSRRTEGLPPTALVIAGEEVDLHRLFAGG